MLTAFHLQSKMFDRIARFIVCCVLIGCSDLHRESSNDPLLLSRMAHADSLAQINRYDDALNEYHTLLEFFPSSQYAGGWVHRLAFLSLSPRNPHANDSVALHWYRLYYSLPTLHPQERDDAEAIVHLLEQKIDLLNVFRQKQFLADSLSLEGTKQSTELAAQSKRIKDLEIQLKTISDELKKLREVDIHISRRTKSP